MLTAYFTIHRIITPSFLFLLLGDNALFMTQFIIMGIIAYLIHLALKKNKKKNSLPPTSSKKIWKVENEDNSIIDVTHQSYRINYHDDSILPKEEVPYWAHQYISSYAQLDQATTLQKVFYFSFKKSFLADKPIDFDGNTNYPFILLFDLLQEYDAHQNVALLAEQLEKLGKLCPKVKPYGRSFLIEKINGRGSVISIIGTATKEPYNYDNSAAFSEHDYWRLGNNYKVQLGLSKREAALLNQLYYSTNNFNSIDFCMVEIIRLFLAVVKDMEQQSQEVDSSLKEEIALFTDTLATQQHGYRPGNYDYNYSVSSTKKEVYSNLFKWCENNVRTHYGHKRQLKITTKYNNEQAKAAYQTRILVKAEAAMSKLLPTITPPNKDTEAELFAQNPSRWKPPFKALQTNFSGDVNAFFEAVLALGTLNKKNSAIEQIFFDAAKFIAKHDAVIALQLYLHYTYHDLQSVKVNQKQLPKTVLKKLFKKEEQAQEFERILKSFKKDNNLDKALEQVPSVFVTKRKKITLDKSSIQAVQQQHSGTVELLNEYLQDEEEETVEEKIAPIVVAKQEPIKTAVVPKKTIEPSSPFVKELSFTPLQLATLTLFSSQDFSVSQEALKTFAKANGAFKNQLIESINEACYELLDDVLIEEEDDTYTIEIDYFDQISVKC